MFKCFKIINNQSVLRGVLNKNILLLNKTYSLQLKYITTLNHFNKKAFSNLDLKNSSNTNTNISEKIINQSVNKNSTSIITNPVTETINSRQFEMKISFHSKIQISKDGFVIRFLLPEDTSSSKFKTCRYVYLEGIPTKSGEIMKRPYHPISLDTDKGFIDIFIKVYQKNPREKFGIFSNFLSNLQEGQVITLHGSYGHMEYTGKGNFSIVKDEKNEIIYKKVKKIGMIAGGSGIAPMFQLIQKITSSRNDNTAISLIYCTKSIEEMNFGEDLIKFDRKGKISFYPVVENVDNPDWAFGKGRVNEEMIYNYMPDAAGVILICGTRAMINTFTKPMLLSMGYKEENILTFE